jgi:hypothetical protein
MTSIPEYSPTPEETEIIARAPLLQTYLSPRPVDAKWVKAMYEQAGPLLKEISRDGNSDKFWTSTEAIVVYTATQPIYRPGIPYQLRTRFFTTLMLIGYQIGSLEDVAKINNLMTNTVTRDRMFNPAHNDEPLAQSMRSSAIMGIMVTGSSVSLSSGNPQLGIFRNFINGQEFQGPDLGTSL